MEEKVLEVNVVREGDSGSHQRVTVQGVGLSIPRSDTDVTERSNLRVNKGWRVWR